ncbi:MAG: RagB/SusD family nutrient uptake outer membrane protein [Muribaculum sp.]|nr:RagB/SusD family nutrient uptake outer membrane protein [Muribaculum sp.]
MKKQVIYSLFALCTASGLTGCLEEFTPTTGALGEQIENVDKSGLSNAVSAYMNHASMSGDGGSVYDIGFMGFAIWRDAMTADLPAYKTDFDYYTVFGYQTQLGNYALESFFWRRYYSLIQKTNLVMGVSDPENDDDKRYVGNALAYRAMAYMDMARYYEVRRTDVASYDQRAESVKGLTVPIVTENTTDAEGRDNPRAPYYEMYRFILTDLNLAERCLANVHAASSKVDACLGVVYGLKARFYLDLGSRYTLYPDELAKQTESESAESLSGYDKFGLTTAKDYLSEAARYARLAIAEGFQPLSESEWFNPQTGFNSANQSWMWCIALSPDDPIATSFVWQSFPSYMTPEASWGIATPQYGASRMVDADLFSTIPSNDWRKTTWIAPDDVADEEAYKTKYARGTSLGFDTWSKLGAYVGLKFHPAGGDCNNSTSGNAVSLPLMRVEEMYYIEAEAVARTSGVAAGAQLLTEFVNGNRCSDGRYSAPSSSLEAFIDEIFKQKRIEFWGEGLILWDYRRLEKAIVRGYLGTNHYSEFCFNSYPNAVAPWTILYIPDSERNYNRAMVLNPDPSNALTLWKE